MGRTPAHCHYYCVNKYWTSLLTQAPELELYLTVLLYSGQGLMGKILKLLVTPVSSHTVLPGIT